MATREVLKQQKRTEHKVTEDSTGAFRVSQDTGGKTTGATWEATPS
jgi:hypothetical protein